MKNLILLLSLMAYLNIYAQDPDDALRTSWFTQNGTARNMAIGGAMGSLGGDLSAAHINPAGIGLFKTREFVVSPTFNFGNNKMAYRGSDSTARHNSFQSGPIGFIFGGVPKIPGSWTSFAFSISYNQVANYNNHIQYSGFNNYSSFTEKYLEELTRDGADTTAAANNYIFGSSLAYNTYLIDTISIGGQMGYKSMVPISSGVIQTNDIVSTGGFNEIAFCFAGNRGDHLFLGASLTIPFINYQRVTTYTEKDATNNPNNNFSYFTYNETYSSSGLGVGLKLGMIAKPADAWRIGFAVHTPQFIAFNDQIRSSITANTEAYAGLRTVSSDDLNKGNPGTSNYNLLTPYRIIGSLSYVLGEQEDTKNQKGFLTGDIEFVNYKGARYSAQDKSDNGLVTYYNTVNDAIKSYNKGNINVKIGGELKFDPVMARLGLAHYGSPYAQSVLKAGRTVLSGGLGYRQHGIFIDLSYAYTIIQDVQFPYRLNDLANTFAMIKGGKSNIALTFGVKF